MSFVNHSAVKNALHGENVEKLKQSASLTTISWEYIVFTNILPKLNWKDLFRLRSVNWQCKQMVEAYFRQIKVIDLTGFSHRISLSAFQIISTGCTNLRTLKIQACLSITDKDLAPVFKMNNKLSLLNLSSCTKLNGSCLLALAVNCKELKTLVLRDCTWLSDGALETLITHLISLEVVDLSQCTNIGNMQLLPLFQKFSKLREVRLAHVPAVNDTTMITLARSCGGLKILDIRGCGSVTDRGIKMIAEYCILEFIFVNSCNLVTEHSLGLLRGKGARIDIARPGQLIPYVPIRLQT